MRERLYRVLVGEPERKEPPGKPTNISEINTKMDFREVGWESIDWIDLAQGRDRWRVLVNTLMNPRVS
jgi:hypothetical protein